MTENEAISMLEQGDKNEYEADCTYEEYLEAIEMGRKALEELQQYKTIGTVEEFKDLKEKSVAKKPIRNDLCTCPSCGTYNEVIGKRRNTVAFDTVYCWHCGQGIEIKRA